MLRFGISWVALLGGILPSLMGCGGGQDAPPMASQLQAAPNTFCAAVCDYASHCEGQLATGCVSGCLESNANYFEHVSDEYLLKVAPCIDKADCSTDWNTMQQSCYKSIAPTLTPSAAVIDFCKAMSVKFFECYYADDDLTFCSSDFAYWSDAAATRAKACTSADCSGLNSCLSNAFNGTS